MARRNKRTPSPTHKASDVAAPASAPTSTTEWSTDGGKLSDYAVVRPCINPEVLQVEHINSNSLRQNVDAYSTNIHGYGHQLEPVIDFESENVSEQVVTQYELDQAGLWGTPPEISPNQIPQEVENLKSQTRRELARANLFFSSLACSDSSWTKLTRLLRQDLEILGFALLEVRRDTNGRLAGFALPRSHKFVALDTTETVEVRVPYRKSAYGWGTRLEDRLGNLWALTDASGQPKKVFKNTGDPRVISSKTAKTYSSEAELEREEPGVRPATEVVCFRIDHALDHRFGIPRWFGVYKGVQGSRLAESVNLNYFNNKSVPPLALLVSGGSISEDAKARIESYIEDEIKGVENFHKILIIEAMDQRAGAGDPFNSGKIKVELVPLTKAQHDDGLFQKYIASSRDMVGEAMRNPRIVRGDIDGINRATAVAALSFAEGQVYAPLREEFDWWVNNFVLYELGCSAIIYRTQSPIATDLETATAIEGLTKANVLVPGEARKFVERVFNTRLSTISAEWTKQPMPLTLTELLAGGGSTSGEGERQGIGPASAARKILDDMIEDRKDVGA
jgi:capsid portal protein